MIPGVEIKIFLKDGSEKVIRRSALNTEEVFDLLTKGEIDRATVGEAGEAIIDFLETAFKSKAIKYYETYANKEFAAYATAPEEIFARAVNQWLATRHGTVEAVEDMMQQASRFLNELPGDLVDEWNLASFDPYGA